ncbi:MAG: YqgE/AlgH family protein [Hyphomicrobiaceae bacterium]|nr:YqgE/AlgH family protein [Hyphomicrobiaceae bacterium]
MSKSPRLIQKDTGSFLEGQLLIAMPGMPDPRFARAVIYMCAHSPDGAMGLILNQMAKDISFTDLLRQLAILDDEGDGALPGAMASIPVHIGGPVDSRRGFVLHSSDYHAEDATMSIDEHVSLTHTLDILRAIATGTGPLKALLALGYSGWSPGQLESEIQGNGWLHCPADLDIVFDPDPETKYAKALARLGIDPSFLVSDAGHA